MLIYNTLTKQKEEFKPLTEGEVKMYSCGPTVYDFAHIGNLRTYIFMDMLRRALKHEGYKIRGVMNITDVGHLTDDADSGEDKMELASRRQKKSPYEIAEYYTNVFFEDIKALNIGRPEIVAKATDHIQEMIDFVKALMDRGYAYETSDGIYFDIVKFGHYGQLSKQDIDEQLAGARVEVNTEKRHVSDFALWKKAPKEHIMQWESPWGMGYPGWHIECSAMGHKYLGDKFDLHTGGVDHIPIHHENEIAQSEALLGHKPVNYWMHGEFMMVDNGKMSKSLGNTYTVKTLKEKGIDPLSFRYFCLNAHYRNKLNFTWDAVNSAQTSYKRLLEAALAHKSAKEAGDEEQVKGYVNSFFKAVGDDLNVPKALGITWSMLKNVDKCQAVYNALLQMDEILGLDLDRCEEKLKAFEQAQEVELPVEVKDLADQRATARKEKNWALSDKLRDEIKALGFAVEDTSQGQKIKPL